MLLASLCRVLMGGTDSMGLASILIGIEREMRQLGIWESTQPDRIALSSEMPFCYDTLSFNQWMQFVLIVRFRTIIDNRAGLPSTCNILPYAAEALGDVKEDTSQLLDLIKDLDGCFGNN